MKRPLSEGQISVCAKAGPDCGQRVNPAVIHARAATAGAFPGFGRTQIGLPEWPGAALDGADVMDFTVCKAVRRAHQENAITALEFDQTKPAPDAPRVPAGEVGEFETQGIRDLTGFLKRYPNVARGSATAVPTLGARKRDAGAVPRGVRRGWRGRR